MVDDADQQLIVKSQALQPQHTAETQAEGEFLSLHRTNHIHNVICRLNWHHYVFYQIQKGSYQQAQHNNINKELILIFSTESNLYFRYFGFIL